MSSKRSLVKLAQRLQRQSVSQSLPPCFLHARSRDKKQDSFLSPAEQQSSAAAAELQPRALCARHPEAEASPVREASRFPREAQAAMSPIKVYAHRWSQPCRAVIIFCRVNKIDFEEVTVDLFKSQHLTPEFKKINPVAQVPAIVDGRFKLFESHAILRYLASVFPGVADHWYPADLFTRAKIESILDWHHSNLRLGAGTFVYYTALAPFLGLKPRPEATKHAEKVLRQSLARIESVWLKGDAKFLLGSRQPSIADLSLVCEIMQLEALGDDIRNKFMGGHERILAWIDEVKKATNPHFDEAHVFLFQVKAQMQSKAAASAAKQGGSEASSKLKFASKL